MYVVYDVKLTRLVAELYLVFCHHSSLTVSCMTKQHGPGMSVGSVAFPRGLEVSLEILEELEAILVRELMVEGVLEVAFSAMSDNVPEVSAILVDLGTDGEREKRVEVGEAEGDPFEVVTFENLISMNF